MWKYLRHRIVLKEDPRAFRHVITVHNILNLTSHLSHKPDKYSLHFALYFQHRHVADFVKVETDAEPDAGPPPMFTSRCVDF